MHLSHILVVIWALSAFTALAVTAIDIEPTRDRGVAPVLGAMSTSLGAPCLLVKADEAGMLRFCLPMTPTTGEAYTALWEPCNAHCSLVWSVQHIFAR
jgi:hypothetical protein